MHQNLKIDFSLSRSSARFFYFQGLCVVAIAMTHLNSNPSIGASITLLNLNHIPHLGFEITKSPSHLNMIKFYFHFSVII